MKKPHRRTLGAGMEPVPEQPDACYGFGLKAVVGLRIPYLRRRVLQEHPIAESVLRKVADSPLMSYWLRYKL